MKKLVLDENSTIFAESCGFFDCSVFQVSSSSFVVYAYWRNAPIVFSLSSESSPNFSVAFLRGNDTSIFGTLFKPGTSAEPSLNFLHEVNHKNIVESFTDAAVSKQETIDDNSLYNFTDDNVSITSQGSGSWDIVVDFSNPSLGLGFVMAKSLLEFYSSSREIIYQNIKHDL